MKLQNREKLARTPLRAFALDLAEVALEAIDTRNAVRHAVRLEDGALVVSAERIPLDGVERIFVSGVGKCAAPAAEELEQILGDRLTGGVVLYVGDEPKLSKIAAHRGTHPLPSAENVAGAGELARSLAGLTERDLVLFLVTGGGSTLLCLPAEDRPPEEEAALFTTLTKAGATIQELNTVRKHLSRVRGGQVARLAHPARVVGIVFSDVPGDDLQFIASGPTVRDATTVADAEAVLAKFDAPKKCGVEHFALIETPKEDEYFARVSNHIIVSNRIALEAMADAARKAGYEPTIVSTTLTGEARDTGARIAAELHGRAAGTVWLYGGETTVTVRGSGKGGRNQEVALGALHEVYFGELVMAIASDGSDNTEFGGALCDTITRETTIELNLDPITSLAENHSYDFFSKSGDYLMTGPTGSNVADLIVAIKSK